MYPGKHAATDPQRPAFIMAQTGAVVTYGELEARTNRLAHLLRARGLSRLDHYAIFMENSPRYLEACGAAERAGLYYTCINSYLTAEELAYIVNNSEAKILITSEAKRDVALAALRKLPEDRALSRRRRPRQRQARAEPRRGDGALSGDADRRRGARHADALFLGYDRAAERDFAAAADAAAVTAASSVRLSGPALALPRPHDLSVAGPALSLGAAGGGQSHHPPGRHGDHYGTLRSRAISGAGRRPTR